MSYHLRISRRVGKQIGRLQPQDRNRIDTAILKLEEEPRPTDVEKLSGTTNMWRIRVGDYRIIYAVDDRSQLVEILRVAHRREVYRRQ